MKPQEDYCCYFHKGHELEGLCSLLVCNTFCTLRVCREEEVPEDPDKAFFHLRLLLQDPRAS